MALALPATSKVVQWGESDVFKVGGKVFAICNDGLSFKVSEIAFEVLTSDGLGRQARVALDEEDVQVAGVGVPQHLQHVPPVACAGTHDTSPVTCRPCAEPVAHVLLHHAASTRE